VGPESRTSTHEEARLSCLELLYLFGMGKSFEQVQMVTGGEETFRSEVTRRQPATCSSTANVFPTSNLRSIECCSTFRRTRRGLKGPPATCPWGRSSSRYTSPVQINPS
jgi:hypothetical protein